MKLKIERFFVEIFIKYIQYQYGISIIIYNRYTFFIKQKLSQYDPNLMKISI